MGKVNHDVIPGGLSETDHARIFEYAERGWRSSRIARQIKKHPGTVYWFMLRNGLAVTKQRDSAKPYERNGRVCHPYTPDEDAFIVALRVQEYGPREIARLANLRFGKNRSPHGVAVRLVMLATVEDAA